MGDLAQRQVAAVMGKWGASTKTIYSQGCSVPYLIDWTETGAVKVFTGTVTYEEVIESERQITGNSKYMSLRYVVADFMNAQHPGMTESECDDVRALRLGGFYSNPWIKFAFVTEDLKLKSAIEKSVIDGQTLHATKVFQTFEDAMAWATVIRSSVDRPPGNYQ
jgi:hypothetical protein